MASLWRILLLRHETTETLFFRVIRILPVWGVLLVCLFVSLFSWLGDLGVWRFLLVWLWFWWGGRVRAMHVVLILDNYLDN